MTKNKYNYYQVFDDNFQQYCILLNIYDYDFILPPHTIFCQAFYENLHTLHTTKRDATFFPLCSNSNNILVDIQNQFSDFPDAETVLAMCFQIKNGITRPHFAILN